MTDLDRLIQEALTYDPAAKVAVTKLVNLGIQAAPRVIDAFRELSPQQYSANLRKVIVSIRDPELVPILIAVLYERNIDLVMTAFEALGQSRDPRALNPLSDYLSNATNRDARRSLAANALGNLGDARAIPILLQVSSEAFKAKSYELFLSAIIALAKLGNHENASLVIRLARSVREITILPRIAEALEYVICPGLFSTLQQLIRNKQAEVRLHAIDALFYLGIPEAIEELILLAEDKNPTLSGQALARVEDLTGEKFSDTIQTTSMRNWWRKNKARFAKGICYRHGKPIWLPEVIGCLEEPNMKKRTLAELRMITGIDFSSSLLDENQDPDMLMRKVKQWWELEGVRLFKPGCLYKYGHLQNVLAIL